ncbi:hypothetical protein QFC22_004752 [Naganishia vaughanmartiniae]|uniref:Uncharacterized protein n=1 Tax=Naganishia vaughanmartiniae TaxID=1424756 RepID=A0ACC2X0M0_9TREE|nr:hypothetical protein QFC22_004752 [Naganishia vaughanmartiniae]
MLAPSVPSSTATTSIQQSLQPTETQRRRSTRSPSRPADLNEPPIPRILPTETVGRPPGHQISASRSTRKQKSSQPPPMSPVIPTNETAGSQTHASASTSLAPFQPGPSYGRPDRSSKSDSTPELSQRAKEKQAEGVSLMALHDESTSVSPVRSSSGLHPLLTTPYVNPVTHQQQHLEIPTQGCVLKARTRSANAHRTLDAAQALLDEDSDEVDQGPEDGEGAKVDDENVFDSQGYQVDAQKSDDDNDEETDGEAEDEYMPVRETLKKKSSKSGATSQSLARRLRMSSRWFLNRPLASKKVNEHRATATTVKGKTAPRTATHGIDASHPGDDHQTRLDPRHRNYDEDRDGSWYGHRNSHRKSGRLIEAARKGMPGIKCPVPTTQATIEKESGDIIPPFKQERFLAAVMKWIIVSGMPFTTIENKHLLKAFQAANPDARLQSARSMARNVEDTFDVVNEKVLAEIQAQPASIHSLTTLGRILAESIRSSGSHSGKRMGDGMFDLFHKEAGISGQLGPGTADNASNNRTAAARLEDLL